MQSITAENCMNVAQTTQVTLSTTGTPNIREVNPVGISNENVFDLAPPVDENTDLAPNFLTDRG